MPKAISHSAPTVPFMAQAVALLFGVLVTASVGPAWAGGNEFRIAHPYNPGSIFGDWVANFAERVEVRTDLRLRIYPGGAVGHSHSLFQAVRSGSIELALVPAEIIATEVPDFQVLSLPGLFRGAEDARRVVENGKLREVLSSSAEKQGFVPLGFGWTFWSIASTSQYIADPRDLKGQRVRTASQLGAELIELAGANPVRIPYSDTFAALQAGYVDAIMTTGAGWENLVKTGAVRSITWSPDFSVAPFGYVLIMNSGMWHKFARKWQRPLLDAALEAGIEFQQKQVEQEKELISAALEMGMKLIEVTPEQQGRWRQVAKPIIDRFREKAPNGKLLLEILSK